MKTLALLALLAALAPAASAVREIPPEEIRVDARACFVSQTYGVDNTFTTVRCAAGGEEIVYHRSGSGFAGYMCEWRVLGEDRPELCFP